MKKFKIFVVLGICLCVFLSMAVFAACSSDSSSDNNDSPSASSSDPTDSSDSSNSATDPIPSEKNEFEIVSPTGTVDLYKTTALNYLKAGKNANVHDFQTSSKDSCAPIEIKWKNSPEGAKSFLVEYSVNEDFSDAIAESVDGNKNKLNIYNLLKAQNYYLRVTALSETESIAVATATFSTPDIGPRVLKIDGIYNVRDLGGYLTASGERTVQGLLFRGGALSDSTDPAYHDVALTDDGKKYMSETLKIKTDFDFRNITENLGLQESPIPNATLEYYGIGAYMSAFSDTERYRKVFSALSDESRYPVYIHCTGGADRTGTVAFLINALLGVDESALIQDYEFTSFSIYGERDSKGTVYKFKDFLEKLKTYEGTTLAEKTENYMLSIGVTSDEIYNIKAIMLGKPCKQTLAAQGKFVEQTDEFFKLVFGTDENADIVVKSLEINGSQTAFSVSGNVITVEKANMPEDLTDGRINGKAVIDELEYAFSFEYDGKYRVSAFTKKDECITLDENNTSATGETKIGYDGVIAEVKVFSLDEKNYGDTFFMIGSYGVRFRGNLFRAAKFETACGEYSPRIEMGSISNVFSSSEGAKLGLSVKIKDEKTVTITVYVDGEIISSADVSRVQNEISSEEAFLTVNIVPDNVTMLCIDSVDLAAKRLDKACDMKL